MRFLPPLGLAAAWLVATGMLSFLAFGYQTFSLVNSVLATLGLSLALGVYWWWFAVRTRGESRRVFLRTYSTLALVLLAVGELWATFGAIRYGLHAFVPTAVMAEDLAIYESRDAFIASARLYEEPRPRLMYSGLSLDGRAYAFYRNSAVLQHAEAEIFGDHAGVQARLRALPQPELDALLAADREFAVLSHSDFGRQRMLPFAIGFVLMAFTTAAHVGLLRWSRGTER